MVSSCVRSLAFFLFAATLAACGGGGGGSAVVPQSGSTNNVIVPPASANANVLELSATNGTISATIKSGTRRAMIAVMSGAPDLAASKAAFAQDSVALTTSVPVAQSAARSLRVHASVRTPVEARISDDARTLSLLRRMQPVPAGGSHLTAKSFASARAGTNADVWVEKSDLGASGGAYQSVPATLELQTAHGNIWIDNSLLSGSGAAASFSAASLSATVAAIGNDFENAYASDVAHFASPDYSASAPGLGPSYKACNADGSNAGSGKAFITEPADGRVNVMVVNPGAFGSGMGGYFSSVNYMPQAALNCISTSYRSNEAPFIYVGWFERNGSSYELKEDLVRATAHELQHLINFVNHGILASTTSYEETFINEGLSMLAQDFAVQRLYGTNFDVDDAVDRASTYLDAPQNYSISGFTGMDGGASAQYNCASGCYGSAYLFQRYLYDRFGGDAYAQSMERSGVVGPANVAAVTHSTLAQVLADFGLALATNSAGVTPTDARYAFGSLNLTGTYADQFGNRSALGGVASVPLSGNSVQVNAPVGGFAFVNVSSVAPAGQPFTITDRATASGFALIGGLVQQ